MVEVEEGDAPDQGMKNNRRFDLQGSFWRAWCWTWKVRDGKDRVFCTGQLCGRKAEGGTGLEED